MPTWARRTLITVATALMVVALWMVLSEVGGQWSVGVATVAVVLLTLWMVFDIESRQRDV